MGIYAQLGTKDDEGNKIGFTRKRGGNDLERIVAGNYELTLVAVKNRKSEKKKNMRHFIVEAQVDACHGVVHENWQGRQLDGPCIKEGDLIQWMVNINVADEDSVSMGLNDVGNFCMSLDAEADEDEINEAFVEAIAKPEYDKETGAANKDGNPTKGTKVKARAYKTGSGFTKVNWAAVTA